MKRGTKQQYQSSSPRSMSVSSVLLVCLVFAFLLHVAHWCYRGYYSGNATTTQAEKQLGGMTGSTSAFVIGLGVLCVGSMLLFLREVRNHETTKDKYELLDKRRQNEIERAYNTGVRELRSRLSLLGLTDIYDKKKQEFDESYTREKNERSEKQGQKRAFDINDIV